MAESSFKKGLDAQVFLKKVSERTITDAEIENRRAELSKKITMESVLAAWKQDATSSYDPEYTAQWIRQLIDQMKVIDFTRYLVLGATREEKPLLGFVFVVNFMQIASAEYCGRQEPALIELYRLFNVMPYILEVSGCTDTEFKEGKEQELLDMMFSRGSRVFHLETINLK